MTDSASVISELQMLLQEVSIPTSAQGAAPIDPFREPLKMGEMGFSMVLVL